ncbi:MAG: hypothetical protein H6887_02445 [Hoeflea sp.]|nr:hypothetical protein [Hoeflea sp.]
MPRIPFLDTLFCWLRLRLTPGQPPSPASSRNKTPDRSHPQPAIRMHASPGAHMFRPGSDTR